MYRIMHVDPDHYSREKMKEMLDWKRCGFTMQDHADSMQSALDLFNKHQYALILINMTQLNYEGLQVCEHIRKESRIPIILLGGSLDFQLVRKALNLQISDYLPEPVDPDEFKSCIFTIKKNLEASFPIGEWNRKLAKRSIHPNKSSNNILEKVKAYVEEEISENITLKKISKTLNYNCSYLGQKFKTHEKMTFNEYLLQRRMEKAKLLLENTNMKIYEIANEVGYIELDWFYKKFKSYVGISATEYRNRKLSISK
ncbi:YesN/AraC family two-component response regulator [Evansella vedderi]|uniref:YesN/AraC family two-component response regulator n=1 Tax=Evansella vedderi TaxID=38282 RepID=A0ABT9ZPR8_9BACI|nr:helix-turn-helix domain-containing protein [Evansella vedderi]MDQ0253230.1 YesN/AraC family two-component response regulator [Evansella vedderi]